MVLKMWKVKTASKKDVDEIVTLYNHVWKDYIGILPKPLLNDRTPNNDKILHWVENKKCFIVRSKEKLVGVVRCSLEYGTCLLDRMAVDEKFRKQGIGIALTERVIEYAKENNASKVWLDTSPRLKEAESLYKKLGFKECGYLKKHYWGEDIKFFELLLYY